MGGWCLNQRNLPPGRGISAFHMGFKMFSFLAESVAVVVQGPWKWGFGCWAPTPCNLPSREHVLGVCSWRLDWPGHLGTVYNGGVFLLFFWEKSWSKRKSLIKKKTHNKPQNKQKQNKRRLNCNYLEKWLSCSPSDLSTNERSFSIPSSYTKKNGKTVKARVLLTGCCSAIQLPFPGIIMGNHRFL